MNSPSSIPSLSAVSAFTLTHTATALRKPWSRLIPCAAVQKLRTLTPLDWSEVKEDLDPANFNIGNFQERLKARDPWADFFKSRQPLAPAIKALAKL